MNAPVLVAGLVVAVVVVASRLLARRLGVPYPVFLVVAGAAASFVPHVPSVELNPRVVFLGFLPPLVYHAGVVTSPREMRTNAIPIGLSAMGLVLATTFAVAAADQAATPVLGWVSAFVLGSVTAPTDPVAAISVLRRLGAPPRLTVIVEGESLVNDGIALALFSVGVAAATSPTSFGAGVVDFARIAGGGTAFGLAVGWLASRIRNPLHDSAAQIVVSLLVPFVAYLPADALGLSGVLAALTTGLVLGQQPASALQPAGRIRVSEFWEVLVFLLESALFVLVGSQLRRIVDGISSYSSADIFLATAAAVLTVLGVRIAWWLAVPTLRWRPEGRLVDTGAVPWRDRLLLGWCGLRGAISLAAALSIPLTVKGRPFPGRNLILFVTFCVIAATLVVQATTLAWLLRRLGLAGSDLERRQRGLAERRLAEAALRRLDELAAEERIGDDDAGLLRQIYERRLDQARADLADGSQVSSSMLQSARLELLAVQHHVLNRLHREGEISFSVMRQLTLEINLEQASLRHDER